MFFGCVFEIPDSNSEKYSHGSCLRYSVAFRTVAIKSGDTICNDLSSWSNTSSSHECEADTRPHRQPISQLRELARSFELLNH